MSENKDIAILIPFRDEEKNLGVLLDDLDRLGFKNEFELIFINDHSSDHSLTVLKSHRLFSHLTILDLSTNQFGKKKALEFGVKSSRCAFFWSIDADVRLKKIRFEQLKKSLILDFDLLVLPVTMVDGIGLLRKIQILEWQLLQTWTFLSLASGYPLMANGANLVFKKELFLEQNENRFGYLSGDDMNILHQAMISSSKIQHLNLEATSVEIEGVNTWSEFFDQRWRWSGKIKNYPRSVMHIFVVLFSFWNLLFLLSEILVFYSLKFTIMLIILAAIQVVFISRNQRQVHGRFTPIAHFLFSFIYPFMSLFFFITSRFIHVKWKGRTLSLKYVSESGK